MLRSLYKGKVIPWEYHPRQTEGRKELIREFSEAEERLVSCLSKEGQKAFEEWQGWRSKVSTLEDENLFAYAFSLGALMMFDMIEEMENAGVR